MISIVSDDEDGVEELTVMSSDEEAVVNYMLVPSMRLFWPTPGSPDLFSDAVCRNGEHLEHFDELRGKLFGRPRQFCRIAEYASSDVRDLLEWPVAFAGRMQQLAPATYRRCLELMRCGRLRIRTQSSGADFAAVSLGQWCTQISLLCGFMLSFVNESAWEVRDTSCAVSEYQSKVRCVERLDDRGDL